MCAFVHGGRSSAKNGGLANLLPIFRECTGHGHTKGIGCRGRIDCLRTWQVIAHRTVEGPMQLNMACVTEPARGFRADLANSRTSLRRIRGQTGDE